MNAYSTNINQEGICGCLARVVSISLTIHNRDFFGWQDQNVPLNDYFQITESEGFKHGKSKISYINSSTRSTEYVCHTTYLFLAQNNEVCFSTRLLFYNMQGFRYTQGLKRQKCWLPNYCSYNVWGLGKTYFTCSTSSNSNE